MRNLTQWIIAKRSLFLGGGLLITFFIISQKNFLLFHTLAELSSIVVAWSVLLLVWNTRRLSDNQSMLLLGIAYFFIGLIDLLHTLSYKGIGVFGPSITADHATQLWIVARGMEAFSLLLYASWQKRSLMAWIALTGYLTVTALLLSSIFWWRNFPTCYVEGLGLTDFKVYSEYVICTVILFVIITFFRNRHQVNGSVFKIMVWALVLTMGSELAFTFYTSVYGISNILGHYLKLVSFALIYLALVRTTLTRPFATLFKNLQDEKIALHESERQLSTLIGNLPGMAYRCINDPNWSMIFLSEGCFELTGYEAQQLLKNETISYNNIIHPEDKERVWAAVQVAIESRVPFEFEYRIQSADGLQKYVWEKGVGIYDGDKVKFLEGFIADITNRKFAEIEHKRLLKHMYQSQKLEAIGTMVGGVSHELNNVFQSIFLYAGLLQDDLGDNQESLENLEHLIKDSERARDLVKQILTFSRNEKIDLRPGPIHEIVLDALNFERASLPANIILEHDVDDNCGPTLADSTQIHQIVINLCNNAKHAMEPDGGLLSVSLEKTLDAIKIGDSKTEVIELVVKDTGCGMSATVQQQIFNPFFTTKELGKGTGLGLSVVFGIIENMGGRLQVESELEKGSCFRIFLPIYQGEIEEDQKTNKTFDEVEGLSILLCDDESSIASAAEAYFKGKGYLIDVASDGQKGLDLFRGSPEKYNFVITDLSMPGLSGLELAKGIRELNVHIPIILSSGILQTQETDEYALLGINAFIQKPWTFEQLMNEINGLTTQK